MGVLILKVKCRSCGFKSMPIRGDRCRRCNRVIPEAQKKPVAKELFHPSAEGRKSSGSKGFSKESTLTKLLRQKGLLKRLKHDNLDRQQEVEPEQEIQILPDFREQKDCKSQGGLQQQKELNVKVQNAIENEPVADKESSEDYFEPPFFLSHIPDKFPPVVLTDVAVTRRVTEKEPSINDWQSYEKSVCLWKNRDEDLEDLISGTMTGYFTLIPCNSVRIGSYKVIPEEKVILSSIGVWMCIPTIQDAEEKVTLTIDIFEIKKVLTFFSKPATIFIYVIPSAVKRIQRLLDMDRSEGPYFDPRSSDDTEKRITLLCKALHVDMIKAVKDIFGNLNMLEELTADESNDLLVRSSPKYAPFHSDMISVFL